MKKLSAPSFQRARDYLRAHARPLEQALFAHEFEGAPARDVLAALAAFQNPDGGFGRALEPDLRTAASSGLGTATALDVLRELGADDGDSLVRAGLAWLVERFDPEIPGWRYVGADVDSEPHAPWWSWELHRAGGPWDHLVNPGGRFLSHLSHWPRLAPRALVESLARAFEKHVTALTTDVGGDALHYAAQVDNGATRAKLREIAVAAVSREAATWTSYCTKPLKLAPGPDSPLAECLVSETAANLDWEIDQQRPDGAWEPNWDWQGQHPAAWEVARREWRGEVTLRTLRSLRSYGRIAGL